jgi:hypothetical protein
VVFGELGGSCQANACVSTRYEGDCLCRSRHVADWINSSKAVDVT